MITFQPGSYATAGGEILYPAGGSSEGVTLATSENGINLIQLSADVAVTSVETNINEWTIPCVTGVSYWWRTMSGISTTSWNGRQVVYVGAGGPTTSISIYAYFNDGYDDGVVSNSTAPITFPSSGGSVTGDVSFLAMGVFSATSTANALFSTKSPAGQSWTLKKGSLLLWGEVV